MKIYQIKLFPNASQLKNIYYFEKNCARASKRNDPKLNI